MHSVTSVGHATPRVLCPSLMGKSEKFVTADDYLSRRLRILAENSCATAELLIRGGCGVGKKTLVLHSWRLRQAKRPLVRCKGQFICHKSQLDRLLIDADGGDLFVENIDCLSASLQVYLLVASSNVRVIATAPDGYLPKLSERFLVVDVPPLSERSEDVPLIIECLAERFGKKISSDLSVSLAQQRILTTDKLYLFVVNLALLSDCLGNQTITSAIVDEVVSYRDRELVQNYFAFFTARVGLPQLLDSHGLREVCRLSEHAYIHSAMVENGYNISRVSRALSVPLATLSRKIAFHNKKLAG